MLRIDTHYSTESTDFTVAGKLVGPWVIVLEECSQTAIVERPGSAVIVNLADVSFIDDAGRGLLTRRCRPGVALVPTDVLIKGIVEEIEADSVVEKLSGATKKLSPQAASPDASVTFLREEIEVLPVVSSDGSGRTVRVLSQLDVILKAVESLSKDSSLAEARTDVIRPTY